MLPSFSRLNRLQINHLLSKDHLVVFNRLGTLKYSPSDRFMMSVVTSSKHEKRAIGRNKLRRRIYSTVHDTKDTIMGVLYLSKHSYTMEFSEIKDLIHDLISKTQKNTK